MNLIDFHVISTAVIVGVGITFFVSMLAGVVMAVHYLFNEKDEI